jgi:hypothetical protein
MFNKVLLLILIALITVQSVDAMADAVKFHQPNSPYTESDYFHSNQSADLQEQSKKTTEQISDNHCCYCHGVSSGIFSNNSLAFDAIPADNTLSNYQLNYSSLLITPDLRPPIV